MQTIRIGMIGYKFMGKAHVIGHEQTFVHEFHECIKAIAHDTATAPDFSDGVRCRPVLDAVDPSITEARWIAAADR